MQKAMWIWFPGEMESRICNPILFQRDYRGAIEPPFWKVEAPYPSVFFYRKLSLAAPERVKIEAMGVFSVKTEPAWAHIPPDADGLYTLPAGEYTLVLSVYRADGEVPAARVTGETFASDPAFTASADNIHGRRLPVGFCETPDALCRFETRAVPPVSARDGLYDFGRELFGRVKLTDVSGDVRLCYGESEKEALDEASCETLDVLHIDAPRAAYTHDRARGFRYVRALGGKFSSLSALEESSAAPERGAFSCDSARLTDIDAVSRRTLRLCAREAFIDGVKRDRWFWSGDAYQSYLCNYYSMFDPGVNMRTMWALRGKMRVDMHINHIPDYSFWWLIALQDHYLYIGDTDFLRSIYPFAAELMDFCLGRLGDDGLLTGKSDDWVFIDWADMPHEGALSAEQILMLRALEVTRDFARLFGDGAGAEKYARAYIRLRARVFEVFFDPEKCVFYHNAVNGVHTNCVTRYANWFAAMFHLLDADREKRMFESVLSDPAIPGLVTPYCTFFELCALCEAGRFAQVRARIEAYWGGMLDAGATTFWELYDPKETDPYAMYGRPYGKSLCHAWGANPIYLFGRYFLGVRPTAPGYETYEIRPERAGLVRLEGRVPTPKGDISVRVENGIARAKGISGAKGELIYRGRRAIIEGDAEVCIE